MASQWAFETSVWRPRSWLPPNEEPVLRRHHPIGRVVHRGPLHSAGRGHLFVALEALGQLGSCPFHCPARFLLRHCVEPQSCAVEEYRLPPRTDGVCEPLRKRRTEATLRLKAPQLAHEQLAHGGGLIAPRADEAPRPHNLRWSGHHHRSLSKCLRRLRSIGRANECHVVEDVDFRVEAWTRAHIDTSLEQLAHATGRCGTRLHAIFGNVRYEKALLRPIQHLLRVLPDECDCRIDLHQPPERQ